VEKPEQQQKSSSTPAPIPSDSTTQDIGSSLKTKRDTYRVPNRSVIQATEVRSGSYVQVSSSIRVTGDDKDYGTAASETTPGRFQETRILSPGEVRQRAYEALRKAEQKRSQLREEERRYCLNEDE
jgi:hypothetical protein